MKRHLVAVIFVGLALIATQGSAYEGHETGATKILLATGFEPFGGDKTNGSWEALKYLNGKRFMDTEVITAQLPVVWEKAAIRLQELIKLYKPTTVVSFGQADQDPVRLETIARNVREEIPDNEGAKPQTLYIYPQGPPTIETGLPLAEIEKRLRAAGIPVRMSSSAGTYLCNDTFYTLMFSPGTDDAKTILRGFIHVPPINEIVRSNTGKNIYFTKALLHKAAEIIIKTVIDVESH